MTTMLQTPNPFFNASVQDAIYTQKYPAYSPIEGVQLIPLKNIPGDEGDFSEIARLNEHGALEYLPDFKLQQINRTLLFPQSVKAWHVHQQQDEIWYVSPHTQLFVGLWDVRADSKTSDQMMRINVGSGHSRLLFIPHGVAHGSANFWHQDVELFYLVNRQFDLTQPDEFRIPWDAKGAEFWTPERD